MITHNDGFSGTTDVECIRQKVTWILDQWKHRIIAIFLDLTFGTGSFAPSSPALSGLVLPIGVGQGGHQQASAGIGDFRQWSWIPSFENLNLRQNGNAIEDLMTRAAKKQKLPPQVTEEDAPF
ncbi:unnamed protein product [Caenorhabditis brenneri]